MQLTEVARPGRLAGSCRCALLRTWKLGNECLARSLINSARTLLNRFDSMHPGQNTLSTVMRALANRWNMYRRERNRRCRREETREREAEHKSRTLIQSLRFHAARNLQRAQCDSFQSARNHTDICVSRHMAKSTFLSRPSPASRPSHLIQSGRNEEMLAHLGEPTLTVCVCK